MEQLDWFIRNIGWIATLVIALTAACLVFWKYINQWKPEHKIVTVESGAGTESRYSDLLGGLLGGKSSNKAKNIESAVVNIIVNAARGMAIEFVQSWVFKWFVFIILLVAFIATLYFPITFFLDRSVVKTIALEFPKPLCNRSDPNRLLLFIHGWNGDDQETWKNFPVFACGDERLRDYEAISINYPTYMANRNLRIAQLAEWVLESITLKVKNADNFDVTIIAHSMGGLVAKEMVILKKLSEDESIKKIITIGSPHNGAVAANLLSALQINDEFIEDMTEGSAYLTGLHVRWDNTSPRPSVHCFSSPEDKIVKSTSAFFQCETNFTYPQWNHSELVKPENLQDDRYVFPMRYVLTE